MWSLGFMDVFHVPYLSDTNEGQQIFAVIPWEVCSRDTGGLHGRTCGTDGTSRTAASWWSPPISMLDAPRRALERLGPVLFVKQPTYSEAGSQIIPVSSMLSKLFLPRQAPHKRHLQRLGSQWSFKQLSL